MSDAERTIPSDEQRKVAAADAHNSCGQAYNVCMGTGANQAAAAGPSVWHTIESLRRLGAKFAADSEEHVVIKTAVRDLHELQMSATMDREQSLHFQGTVADLRRRIDMARFALTARDDH
jgi:UDP-N-acetylglucosamine enolpyruvyl transferase